LNGKVEENDYQDWSAVDKTRTRGGRYANDEHGEGLTD
jgi:hypothetical protein